MDLDKILDHCQTLEKTISILVRSNSNKEAEVANLQKRIIENSQASLSELLEQERQNQEQLDALKCRKSDLDTEIKQFAEINDKLSHLVSIVQKSDSTEDDDNNCKNDEIYYTITETLEDFEQMKLDHVKLSNKLDQMDSNVNQSAAEIKNLIDLNSNLIVDVQRNDCIIRLSEQQSTYVEQQFDLIINQLPWEPLTDQYIDELRNSNDQAIRDLAETLQLQKNEIEDLNESLGYKKKKKLEVLEQLHEELNTFVHKRDEAILVTRLIDGP